MAKRCTKCGNFMMDDERFCPNCGENAQLPPDAVIPTANTSEQPQQYNTYQQQYNAAPQYMAPPYPVPVEEMSLKKWVITIVVTTFFGIISLIFLFIWAFGDGPESRRRYCKAMLITMLIGLGVGLIFTAIFFSVFAGLITNGINEYARQYQNWDSVYAAILSII